MRFADTLISVGLVVVCASVMGQSRLANASTSNSRKADQITLADLAGTFAETTNGSIVLCFDPETGSQVACSGAGAIAVPFSVVSIGFVTQEGNARCGSFTQTYSNSPPSINSPTVTTCQIASQTTNYDPSSGTGDCSFTTYTGAACAGATISGGTAIRTGSCHFVASQNGNRIDFVITNLSGAGGFSFSGTDSRQ
jgi:hypothetical protein